MKSEIKIVVANVSTGLSCELVASSSQNSLPGGCFMEVKVDMNNTILGKVQGESIPFTTEILTHICSCHNFFPLSSVQILLLPACCLLCVL